MSIVRARLQPYTLSLRDAWPSADGNVNDRRGWILALEDGSGRVGLGDAAPFPGFGLEAHASAGAGLRTLKLKVGGARHAEDEERLRALRDAVGPDVRIRVDANQAWSADEAIEALRALAEYRLEYAEQPVPADDIEGLARVRKSSP